MAFAPPYWIHPLDVVGAMSAGGNLGMGARRNDLEALSIANQGQQIGNQAREAADRLNLDYSSLNQKAAEASDRGAETAARIASERENAAALLALRAQEAQTSSLYHQGELGRQLAADAALEQFHHATASTQAQRANDLALHRSALEKIARDKLTQNQGRFETDGNGHTFWVSGTGAPHPAKSLGSSDKLSASATIEDSDLKNQLTLINTALSKATSDVERAPLEERKAALLTQRQALVPTHYNQNALAPNGWTPTTGGEWERPNLNPARASVDSLTGPAVRSPIYMGLLDGDPTQPTPGVYMGGAGGDPTQPTRGVYMGDSPNAPAPQSPYKVGARYGDLRYLGGDWQDENSWEPAVQATPAGDEP